MDDRGRWALDDRGRSEPDHPRTLICRHCRRRWAAVVADMGPERALFWLQIARSCRRLQAAAAATRQCRHSSLSIAGVFFQSDLHAPIRLISPSTRNQAAKRGPRSLRRREQPVPVASRCGQQALGRSILAQSPRPEARQRPLDLAAAAWVGRGTDGQWAPPAASGHCWP